MKVFLYDAFASDLYAGNVGGVVLLDRMLPDTVLQRMAAEINAPTTGFVTIREPGRYSVRFFSASRCGHVTVATACALVDEGALSYGPAVQETAAGPVPIDVAHRDGRTLVTMTQRLPTFSAADVDVEVLAHLLGVEDGALDLSIRPGIVATGLRHLFVALQEDTSLKEMRRDDRGLTELSRLHRVDTIGVYVVTGGRASARVTVRLRDLCHGVGNPEEPASGTTNGALACHLYSRGVLRGGADRAATLDALQGVEMGRPSSIRTRIVADEAGVRSVEVAGSAVRSLAGVLTRPSLSAAGR